MFAVIGERLRSCNSSIIRLRNGVIPTNSFRLLVYPFIYIHCSGTQPPRTPTLPLSSTPGRAPPAACGCVQTSFMSLIRCARLNKPDFLPYFSIVGPHYQTLEPCTRRC